MKKLLVLSVCVAAICLTGCTNYENSNELVEGDKLLAPYGIGDFENFISKLNNATNYYVTTYNDEIGVQNYQIDGLKKYGYIDDYENFEFFNGGNFELYTTLEGKYIKEGFKETSFNVIPFDLKILNIDDFYYVDYSSMYELKQECLEDYNVEGLYITFDDVTEKIVFSSNVDGLYTDYSFEINSSCIDIPTEFELKLEGLDEITNFFDVGHNSYQTSIYLNDKLHSVGDVVFENFHTPYYSKIGFFHEYTNVCFTGYIEYLDDNEYKFINKYGEDTTYVSKIWQSSIYFNMFVVETYADIYTLLINSYYDSETEKYCTFSAGLYGFFNVSFNPFATDVEGDPTFELDFTFRVASSEEPYYFEATCRAEYFNFGNVDYNDFMELSEDTLSYINMIN